MELWLNNSTSGYFSENKNKNKNKTWTQKDTCAPPCSLHLFSVPKIWKQPKCPSTDEWTKNLWYTQRHPKNGTLAIKRMKCCVCNNMDGPGGSYAMWNKSEKDRYRVLSLLRGIKTTMRLMDRESGPVTARGRGGRQEKWVKRGGEGNHKVKKRSWCKIEMLNYAQHTDHMRNMQLYAHVGHCITYIKTVTYPLFLK